MVAGSHFLCINFLEVKGSPGIKNVSQYKWYQQRDIAHYHQGKFTRRAIHDRQGALEIKIGGIKSSIVQSYNHEERKNS